jgi:hypothetical protein
MFVIDSHHKQIIFWEADGLNHLCAENSCMLSQLGHLIKQVVEQKM